MKVDLSLLHGNSVSSININDYYDISNDLYKDTDVISLSKVHATGKITRKTDDIDYVDLSVSGVMKLLDSISLEEVDYPFSFKIEGDLNDFVENLENSLDISLLLWENIVLEIPLKFTKVSDLSKFQGDGWKLISEEDKSLSENPFSELLKNIEEE